MLKMSSNVFSKPLAFVWLQSFGPEKVGLGEVVLIGGIVPLDVSGNIEARNVSLQGFLSSAEAVGEVIRSIALVVHIHGSITQVVGTPNLIGTVNWDLSIIGTQTVSVGIGVRKQTGLQHLVGAWFDSWNHVGRREGDLLNLSKVV